MNTSKAFDKVWYSGIIFKLQQNGMSVKFINLVTDFLKNRKQRIELNEKASSWVDVTAGVPQGFIVGPVLFLICINDLVDDLSSNVKLVGDDTSLFSIVHEENISVDELGTDLEKISSWLYQWKISFKPDPSKQAQEVVFSYELIKSVHPPLIFINSNMSEASSQKRLGVIFVEFLKFLEHFKIILSKINKSIGLLRKLQSLLPRNALITIYKSFIRPHLDYNDVIYDQTFNYYFHQKFESIQYNACLAITGAIRSTSRDKS